MRRKKSRPSAAPDWPSRLGVRKRDVLRFLSDPTVPFTNDPAERDARMMKVRRRVSGGFRSEAGANGFGAIRSLLPTAGKRGWDMVRTPLTNPAHLIENLRVA